MHHVDFSQLSAKYTKVYTHLSIFDCLLRLQIDAQKL